MIVAFYLDGKTFLDRAIQAVTRSRCSHCELIFSDGRWLGSSATTGGVSFREYIPLGEWRFLSVDIDESDAMITVDAIFESGITGYDYIGIFRSVIPWVPQSESAWFCSELCAFVLKTSGHDLALPYSRYSPGRLMIELEGIDEAEEPLLSSVS